MKTTSKAAEQWMRTSKHGLPTDIPTTGDGAVQEQLGVQELLVRMEYVMVVGWEHSNRAKVRVRC